MAQAGSTPRVIVISGSRTWSNEQQLQKLLQAVVSKAPERELWIVHGDCDTGVDAIIDRLCKNIGIQRFRVPANWRRWGKPAGMRRNRLMLDVFQPNGVIACRSDGDSPGTDGMIELAHSLDIPCKVIHEHR